MRGLGGPGPLGLGCGKIFAALSFIIQHPEWKGREEKKKGILKKHLWEAQSAGMVGSALLLAAVLREGHR